VSWRSPARAERVVIYEEDGGLAQYWRGEDGAGNVLWHSEDPRSGSQASGEAVTTQELVRMVESSLQERRRAARGRKFRL
jgi:hypothetical protein